MSTRVELELRPLVVHVLGVPAPQGSKRHVGRGRLVESSRGVRPWREAVAWSTRSVAQRRRHAGWATGPVALDVEFRMPRPKSLPKTRTVWPWHRPDLDKLLRSTLDGLVDSGVLHDDAQAVTICLRKRYALEGEPLGADVLIVTGAALAQLRGAERVEWQR